MQHAVHGGGGAAQASTAQASTGKVPVGRAGGQNLRGFTAAVPAARWANTPDRIHCRGRADQANPKPHRGRHRATVHSPGTQASTVGWV